MESRGPCPALSLLTCHASPPSPCPSPALGSLDEGLRTSSLPSQTLFVEWGETKTQLYGMMMGNRTKSVRELQQEKLRVE